MMNSSDQFPTQTNKPSTNNESPDLLLSLATVPVLIGIVGIKVVTTTLRELGEVSEEIFRGDRLPVLNSPVAKKAEPEDFKAL